MRPPVKLTFIVASLSVFSGCMVFDEPLDPIADGAACSTNMECSERAGAPAVCVKDTAPYCAQLTSDDCSTVTGDYLDDKAIVIASLLSTTGAQAATNVPRQQAAVMAVEQINASNASGGILQSATPGDTRKLVMVSCDEIANLPRVATHLLTKLKVPAIVGPNLSQDVLDMTIGNPSIGLPSSAQAGTAMFTPTAVASAIATVPDNGLTFMMVPSDIQRVPLMKQQINRIEDELKTVRMKTEIKLAIWSRSDALGEGTRDGLSTLTVNGQSLATAISQGKARADSYDGASTNNATLVAAYAQFQPDIIVVAGTGEAVRYFITPLETAWPAAVPRPYYVLIDSTKTPDLLTAVTGNENLRLRVRGTGIAPTTETDAVYSAFQFAYGQRWKDANGNAQPATQSGMGPAYDAVYTIALSLVGKKEVTGTVISAGLASLSRNTQACTYDVTGVQAPCFSLSDHTRTLYNNMGLLLQNRPVSQLGTFGRLEWDTQGAKTNGRIEMWCIRSDAGRPSFASSGLTYDVKTQQPMGTYTQCGSS